MEREPGSFIAAADGKNIQPNLADEAMAERKKIADEEEARQQAQPARAKKEVAGDADK